MNAKKYCKESFKLGLTRSNLNSASGMAEDQMVEPNQLPLTSEFNTYSHVPVVTPKNEAPADKQIRSYEK